MRSLAAFTAVRRTGSTGGRITAVDDRISPSDGQFRIQSNIIGTNRTLTALLRNGGSLGRS